LICEAANAIKLTMVVARGTAARTKAKKIRKKHQECARQQKEEMQKAEVEGYFARFDLDKNGILDKEEFPELLKALFGEDAVTIGIDSVVARLVKNCEKQGGITPKRM
jgi:Ca2+-binding EF-hand superfamily protein